MLKNNSQLQRKNYSISELNIKYLQMKQLKEYLTPFIGLKNGKHEFTYQINNKFFESFEYDEYESSNIEAHVVLEKKSTMLELYFNHKGTVYVPCDLTGEMFDLPIKGNIKLVVQFGTEFNDSNEELLILPLGEHQIDISQYLYEMIVLSVPSKRIHPDVLNGTMESEALKKLEQLAVNEPIDNKEDEEESSDPRWDELKKLLTDK